MTDRSVPVFYVAIRPTVPAVHKAESVNTEVAIAKKNRDAAAKKADDLYPIVLKPDAGAEVTAEYAKAIRDKLHWNEVYTAAAAAASSLPPAQPPTPPSPEQDFTSRVSQFDYEDDEKKVDLVKLTMDNRDLSLLDSPIIEKGTVLTVMWGYPGNLTPPRECVVQKVTGSLSLSVEAHDKGVLMNKEAKTKVFEGKTRSEVVAAIATENGYGSDRQFITTTPTRYPTITQSSTDAQLMKKLADLEGFEFYVDWDGLHWHARKVEQKPVRILQYYLPPDVGDIESWSLENDISGKPGAFTVKGRDPVERQDVNHTASDENTPRTTLSARPEVSSSPSPTEIIDPRTGEVTQATSSAPKSPTAAPGSAAKPSSASDVRPTTETTESGAKAEATGLFTRSQQATVGLKVLIVGDPSIAAKTVVEIRGLGQRFSGKYYVTTAKHSLSSGGYKTALTLKRDGTNASTGGKSSGDSASKPNNQKADEKNSGVNPAPLTPTEVVDPKTGESKTVYKKA